MSYNGSGTFQINSSGQPVVTGTVISSTAFNALTADLATGLSTAITKDGQTTTTSRIAFAQGVSSTLTTDATSATTGSIITAGGISTQKALWVGTTTTLAGALTYGGVALSNSVTGTGSMVLSASATVTGAWVFNAGANTEGIRFIGTGAYQAFWNTANSTRVGYIINVADTSLNVYGDTGKYLIFGTNATEVARFDISGNLLVGATGSPSNARFRAYGNASAVFDFGPQTAATNNAFVVFNTGGAGAYLTSGSGTWSSTSDIRLKNITGTYESPLEDIAKIQVIKYTWKNDDLNTPQVGVTAQSVQHVVPEAISECQVIPNDETKYLGVRYTELVPLLISSIQELTTRLAALETK